MFFIMGVSQKEKKLDYNEMTICETCRKYGNIDVYMTYNYLMVFFIPIFKWNKEYYVKMACCNMVGKLSEEYGNKIQKGQVANLDINEVCFDTINSNIKVCKSCGYTTDEDFNYCPKCANKF